MCWCCRRCVYVGNLAYNVSWQDLKDHFKPAGSVVHADVMTEPGGRSKGCGLVVFSNAAGATNAIAMLNETQVGLELIAEPRGADRPRDDERAASAGPIRRTWRDGHG